VCACERVCVYVCVYVFVCACVKMSLVSCGADRDKVRQAVHHVYI